MAVGDGPHRGEWPHQDQPLASAGAALTEASAAVVLVHGRGATARSILGLGREITGSGRELSAEGVALLAPQAAGNTWYPNSFLAPVESNEPGRRSGLRAISDAVGRANDAGIPTDRVLLVGFSQGACLASEFVARNPTRYGGLAALSGGLIGQDVDEDDYAEGVDEDDYAEGVDEDDYVDDTALGGTPAFLGCSDVDPHIPVERVHETADTLETLGADVTVRIYEEMGHGVNDDEIEFVSGMVADLVGRGC